jgi:hypothetical protein
MFRFAFSKLTAVFVLIAVLGVPLSSTAASHTTSGSTASRSAIPLSFAWLRNLLAPAWAKSDEGCRIDPNGTPCLRTPAVAPDKGELDRVPQPRDRRQER